MNTTKDWMILWIKKNLVEMSVMSKRKLSLIVVQKSKFLIPVEGKKWVMTGLRDAWRRYKQKIKKKFFDKNSTLEDMLEKRPDGIPENQFCQLIEYWLHPTVQAICEMNSQNRKKQKWRHRMGPINFARICVALAELQNRKSSGETTDDAFTVVFGKEHPGRLRCYGRSVTKSSLKKHEEIKDLKQKHANEITSLKEELREEMRHLFTPLLQNNPGLNFQDIQGCVGSNLASPIDVSSAKALRGKIFHILQDQLMIQFFKREMLVIEFELWQK
ncbi:uncharacterized protein LOC114077908 isoform X2 [Solanum pennellii]|nr:uncharacterized protein LOC114077908 isoform X2 [Solanum pennellii]